MTSPDGMWEMQRPGQKLCQVNECGVPACVKSSDVFMCGGCAGDVIAALAGEIVALHTVISDRARAKECGSDALGRCGELGLHDARQLNSVVDASKKRLMERTPLDSLVNSIVKELLT